jgi:hypothetical protein
LIKETNGAEASNSDFPFFPKKKKQSTNIRKLQVKPVSRQPGHPELPGNQDP